MDWLAAGLPSAGTNASEPRIGSLAHADVPRCGLQDELAVVRQQVHASAWNICVVTTPEGVVLGLLGDDVLRSDARASVTEAMEPAPSTFRAKVSVHEMDEYLDEHASLRTVLVSDPDGVLLGAVTRDEIAESHQ